MVGQGVTLKGIIVKKVLLLFSCILSACQDDGSYMPNRTPDTITDSGVAIYFEIDDPNKESRALDMREPIEKAWTDIQNCTGMESKNPPVALIVFDIDQWFLNKKRWPSKECADGCALYDENIILIEDHASYDFNLWRHEGMHIVLNQNGVSERSNSRHEPAKLWECESYDSAPQIKQPPEEDQPDYGAPYPWVDEGKRGPPYTPSSSAG
jgi:hypothetical protein